MTVKEARDQSLGIFDHLVFEAVRIRLGRDPKMEEIVKDGRMVINVESGTIFFYWKYEPMVYIKDTGKSYQTGHVPW